MGSMIRSDEGNESLDMKKHVHMSDPGLDVIKKGSIQNTFGFFRRM